MIKELLDQLAKSCEINSSAMLKNMSDVDRQTAIRISEGLVDYFCRHEKRTQLPCLIAGAFMANYALIHDLINNIEISEKDDLSCKVLRFDRAK